MLDFKEIKSNMESKITNAEKVIIIPHNNVDFDAIASSLGVCVIAKKLKKKSYVIVNDKTHLIEPGVKLIMDECKEEFNIINGEKYNSMAHPNDMFVLADVNKRNLVSVSMPLDKKENIMIFDHHDIDSATIEADNTYIDTNSSSASEIITNLLVQFKIKIPPNIADCLYAGIFLDTARLTKNCSAETMKAAAKLLESGANINRVNDLFQEDFLSDRKVQNLINSTQIFDCRIALIIAGEDEEYRREEIAKAADYSLKYGADASFVIGKIEDDVVSISSRSREKINVGYIMGLINGGGNVYSGAAKVENESVEDVGKRLIKIIKPPYYIDN